MKNKKKTAFLFPGQGAQYIGMGKDFYSEFNIAKHIFQEADDFLNYKISDLMFNGDLKTLIKPNICQLAIYINSIAILEVIKNEFNLKCDFSSGLSLGEYSALYASGIISFIEGLKLLHKRSALMSSSCKKNKGSMAAVIGEGDESIKSLIDFLQKKGKEIWIANYNAPNQTVISGNKKDLIDVQNIFLEKGFKRFLLLNVEGAFHSKLMIDAETQFADFIKDFNFHNTNNYNIIMNFNAKIPTSIDDIKFNLIKQISNSVKWMQSIKLIQELGAQIYIEIGCGNVLTKLNKSNKILGTSIFINSIKDLHKIDMIMKEEFADS